MPMLRMAVSALIALSLDLFSEVVIIHWLDLPSVHTVHVWPPYFNLVMAWNTGIDFGLLSNYGGRWLLVAFPIAVSLGLTAWVRNKRGWILPLATGAVVGGALGNSFDRVIYGAVVGWSGKVFTYVYSCAVMCHEVHLGRQKAAGKSP
ncbi:MAG: signal peptidase II [Acidithiobacillus sp.]